MKQLRFSVDVDAPAQQVWNVMLDKESYREWTRSFNEGSTYEGGWNEGDEIRFVGPNDDGTVSGLFESYSFSENDGVTTVVVELDVPDEWADMMHEMWQVAIVAIKDLAERA